MTEPSTSTLTQEEKNTYALSEPAHPDFPFILKKFNGIAFWGWNIKVDTCNICRVKLIESCLRCQTEKKANQGKAGDTCVVVAGTCNHVFHNCCMSLWIQQSNRCPMCQQDWTVQKIAQ